MDEEALPGAVGLDVRNESLLLADELLPLLVAEHSGSY